LDTRLMNNQPSVLQALFPHLADVEIDDVGRVGPAVRIRPHARAKAAACPACGTTSRRVHARYVHRLADRAVGGQETAIDLAVRRFVCIKGDCPKQTFAEQVPGLIVRHQRRRVPLQRLLALGGLALGGRPGAKLTRHLAAEVSAATLLRLVRALPSPPVCAVRVLGVDEFAFRRGRVYGAILLDMATHRPVDVLPGRTADTLARWLQAHPDVEIFCRDRAGSFAEGADRGIPRVPQVADRWHLLHNLAGAVEQAVARHRACLREPQPEPGRSVPVADEPPRAPKVRALHAEVHALLARGVNLTTIAQTLGRDPKTVRRYARLSP
jgi:transposase